MEKVIDATRVTRGYQITLTKVVREKLNADVGDVILFVEKDGEIVIRKA